MGARATARDGRWMDVRTLPSPALGLLRYTTQRDIVVSLRIGRAGDVGGREREDESRTREQAMPQGVPHTGEKVRSQSQEG